MANFADDDDFGDFVMVAPTSVTTPQVGRLDSFDFGGPVESATPPVASVPEATPAKNRAPISPSRLDSFAFGGPVGSESAPVASVPEATPAEHRAPLSPSPVSEMLMSMHGLKKDISAAGGPLGAKKHPPSGASADPFSLDFAFSEPSSKDPFSNPTSGVTFEGSPAAFENDWGDFSAVKVKTATTDVSKPSADVSKPSAEVSRPAAADVIIPDADISSEALKPPPKPPLLSSIHPPLSWTTGVRTSPRHPDSKPGLRDSRLGLTDLRPGLTTRVTRSPRSSPHGSPRSSPQRSSPRARRSSLEPATSSPRSSTLSRPGSKTEPAKSESPKSESSSVSSKMKPGAKPKGGAVLIGNLMPLNGQRERRSSSNQDLNQARFAMAAGLASEWASDFAGQEGGAGTNGAAPAVAAPVHLADLMDWGEDDSTGTDAPLASAAAPDADFGDDFGDFVSATSSTSTSRRTSDFDFFSSEPLSETVAQPNGSSSGLHEGLGLAAEPGSAGRSGNGLQGLFAAGGTITAKGMNGSDASHVARGQSATGGLDGLGSAFGQTSDFLGDGFPTSGPQQNGLEKRPGELTGQNGRGIPGTFAAPLVVEFGSELGEVKQGVDSLTPQSTLHSSTPPLFPDPEPFSDGLATVAAVGDPFGGLSEAPSVSAFDQPSVAATGSVTSLSGLEERSVLASEKPSESASGQASEGASERSGIKGSGRLSRSMFGEESDEETEPGLPTGVSATGAKSAPPAVSLEALLSSSEYQTSIAKAWGSSENGASSGPSDGKINGQPSDGRTDGAKDDVSTAAPVAGVANGNGFDGGLETASVLESFASFNFGLAGTGISSSAPSGGVPNAATSTPQEEDDEFGDFAAVDTSSGGADVSEGCGAGGTRSKGASPRGSDSLDDALVGGFEFPSGASGSSLENGFVASEGAVKLDTGFGLTGRSERAIPTVSELPNLFGGFDASPSSSAPAPSQVDPFNIPGDPFQDFAANSASEMVPVGGKKAAGGVENGRPAVAASERTKTGASGNDDLFGANGGTSVADFEEDNGFGDFVDSRRSSGTAASVSVGDPFGVSSGTRRDSSDPFGVNSNAPGVSSGPFGVNSEVGRVSGAVASTPGDAFFTGGFHDSARTSTPGDPFEGLEGLAETTSGIGSPSGVRSSEGREAMETGDLFGISAGFSNAGTAQLGATSGSGEFGNVGGFVSSSAGQVSNGSQATGLDFNFLSSVAITTTPNLVETNPVQDPFLDLMGMDVSVPSTSGSFQGFDLGGLEIQGSAGVSDTQGLQGLNENQGLAGGNDSQGLQGFGGTQGLTGVSEPRRSFSERRERRERSRRSSSVSEGGSAQNQGSHSRAASWQGGGNGTLERTVGSTGSGKRTSYKEGDMLEVGMQLLEEGRMGEARPCWAHIEAQRKLPEKKAQYERAMVSSPMKAFDIMKEIHDLEGSLAPAHQVATWQKPPGIGSRRSSSNASENGRSKGRNDADAPEEVQRAFVRAWEDLAHACADELEEGQEIWQRARDAGCDQELLRSAKGRQYFASLCRVYLLSALLSALAQWRKPWLAAASGEGLRSCLADCRRAAEGDLSRALRAASERSKGLGFTDVWAVARGAVLEAAVGTGPRQPVGKGPGRPACGLTLVPQDALQGLPLVTWQGQTFLAPVANLWRCKVSEALPAGLFLPNT